MVVGGHTAQCTIVQSIGPSKDFGPGACLPAAAALFGHEVLVGQVVFLEKAWPYFPTPYTLYFWLPGLQTNPPNPQHAAVSLSAHYTE